MIQSGRVARHPSGGVLTTNVGMIRKVLIVVLLGIAAYVAIALPRGISNFRKIQTRDRIKILKMAQDQYYASTGAFPHTVDNASLVAELRQRGILGPAQGKINESGEFLDAWDTPFRATMSEHGAIIESAGPDRAFGTADDLGSKR